jgi:phosphoglycolate phosphatase
MDKFEAAIFDIDGTIWNIFPLYYKAVTKSLKNHGIPPPDFDYLTGMLKSGESFREKLADMTRSLTLDVSIDEVIMEIRDIFNDLEERTLKPYPGAKDLFSQLKKHRLKIGLATGRRAPRERIRKICRKMGLDHFVDAVTSQHYVQNRKPAPDLIIDCARRLKVPIEKCLVVGDTKDDILAAHGAGGTAIGILSGIDNYKQMMEVRPLAVVKSLEEILEFV